MATNPMQRKARNSFLLGMLVMLLILGIVIALLIMYLMQIKKEQAELEASYVNVYVLNRDVKSGDEVTASDFELIKTTKKAAPTNPISPDGLTKQLGEDGVAIAKINLTQGTVISADMLYEDAQAIGDDVRKQEYNTVVLPMDLETGDYIDIRLLLPSGQDYIVVSKKKVEIPQVAGVDSANTIWVEMSEDEILTMSNAIVEAYMINGSKLYATVYTEAGNQEASTPTYPVNGEVAKLVESNPNIVDTALNALRNRYNKELRENYINPAISGQEDAKENEETKMTESITNSQNSRQEYLESLTGGITTTE